MRLWRAMVGQGRRWVRSSITWRSGTRTRDRSQEMPGTSAIWTENRRMGCETVRAMFWGQNIAPSKSDFGK